MIDDDGGHRRQASGDVLHAHLGVLPCRAGRESGDVIAEEVEEPELVPAPERLLDLFFAHGISLGEPSGSADIDAEEVQ